MDFVIQGPTKSTREWTEEGKTNHNPTNKLSERTPNTKGAKM